MTAPGDGISLGLVAMVVLAVCGVAGTTALYQDSARELHEDNEALRATNADLSDRLNGTERDLDEARDRIDTLESQLATRERDVETVAAELDETERELRATESRLAETRESIGGAEPQDGPGTGDGGAGADRQSGEPNRAGDLQERVDRLETRVSLGKAHVERLEDELRAIERENDDLRDRLRELCSDPETREDPACEGVGEDRIRD